MKVALCFSGLPRFLHETLPYWKKSILDVYSPDVFVHVWKNQDHSDLNVKNFIMDAYAPKAMVQQPPKTFDVSIYNERIWPHRTTPQNQLSQYYGIWRSQTLRQEYENHLDRRYDIVIRSRFDWFLENVNLEVNNCINVAHTPTLCNHRFMWEGGEYVGINDQFAYGSSGNMTLYGNLINNLPFLYSQKQIDFCGELFLKSHLLFHNIPVKEHNWNNGIVRQTHIMP
jgi:hypothetical protein